MAASESPFRSLPGLILGLLALCFFLIAGCASIDLPGLHYDEAIFVNAALGGVDDSFVHKRVLGVPVLIMHYIGALKAWIHAPVFALLGVSPATIRMPGLFLAALTILLAGHVASRLFGRGSGVVLVLLLATDPALLLMSRTDWGPTVLMNLCKVSALALFFSWIREPRTAALAGLLACLLVGLFDKLTFLWFVVALGVAGASVWPVRSLRGIRRGGIASLVVLVVFAALVWAFAVTKVLWLMRNRSAREDIPADVIGRLGEFAGVYLDTMDGTAIQAQQFVGPARASWVHLLGALALVSLLGVLLFARRRAEPPRDPGVLAPPRLAAFFLFLFAVIAAQIVMTPQAWGPHHLMLTYPIHHLFALSVFAVLRERVSFRGLDYLGAALAAVVIVSQVRVVLAYHERLADPRSMTAGWSPAVYDLAKRVEGLEADLIVSADWGIHVPLFSIAASERRRHMADRWLLFWEMDPSDRQACEAVATEQFAGKTVAFLLRSPNAEGLPPCRQNFLAFASAYLRGSWQVRVVEDPSGSSLFEIRVLTPG